MTTPASGRARERAHERKRLAVRALKRAMAETGEAERLDVVSRCGVSAASGSRATYGWEVPADAFFALCAGFGIDPMAGDEIPPDPGPREFHWTSLAIAVAFKRHTEFLGMRAAADQCGISIASLSRLENMQALSLESVIALCAWIGRHPDEFGQKVSRVTHCNTQAAA